MGLAVVGIMAGVLFGAASSSPRWGLGRPKALALAEDTIADTATRSSVAFAIFAADAKVAFVVGSFSEWKPVQLADSDGDGLWTAQIQLFPGRHEYAFIIDGRWFGQDPSADGYVRSFGEYSSVRYVGGGDDGA